VAGSGVILLEIARLRFSAPLRCPDVAVWMLVRLLLNQSITPRRLRRRATITRGHSVSLSLSLSLSLSAFHLRYFVIMQGKVDYRYYRYARIIPRYLHGKFGKVGEILQRTKIEDDYIGASPRHDITMLLVNRKRNNNSPLTALCTISRWPCRFVRFD